MIDSHWIMPENSHKIYLDASHEPTWSVMPECVPRVVAYLSLGEFDGLWCIYIYIYGTYIYILFIFIHGVCKSTKKSGGHHLVSTVRLLVFSWRRLQHVKTSLRFPNTVRNPSSGVPWWRMRGCRRCHISSHHPWWCCLKKRESHG